MWIDSHCHLNHARYEGRSPADIVAQASAAGVDGMLSINVRIASEFPVIRDIANSHANVWCTIGTHPHDAGLAEEKSITESDLLNHIRANPRLVGIGETGLDYYYNYSTPEDQEHSFRKHIRVAMESELPLVIHARDADADIIRVLKEEGAGDKRLRGVMHCFSSGAPMAQDALDIGFYVSFSGMITFKKSQDLRDIAAAMPLDRLLVETDAPFLAPEPHRGGLNNPAYVPFVGEKLAAIKDISAAEMAAITTRNFFTLFARAVA